MITSVFRALRTLLQILRTRRQILPEVFEVTNTFSHKAPLAFYDNTEPAIVLKNHSSFQVSYSVIQEDKLKTTAITEAISRKMDASLAVSGGAVTGTLGVGAARETKRIQEQHQDGYVLMEDSRVGPEGTTVPFPKDCNDLRVLGYFREDSSQTWTLFKNKVYSISWGKKIITLVATDVVIERHL